MPADLRINVAMDEDPRLAILTCSGPFNTSTRPQFDQQVAHLIDGGIRHLVLDLSNLDYIGSAGIDSLITCRERLLPEGGALHLTRPTNAVRQVIRILGLEVLFTVHQDLATAIAAARAHGPSTKVAG